MFEQLSTTEGDACVSQSEMVLFGTGGRWPPDRPPMTSSGGKKTLVSVFRGSETTFLFPKPPFKTFWSSVWCAELCSRWECLITSADQNKRQRVDCFLEILKIFSSLELPDIVQDESWIPCEFEDQRWMWITKPGQVRNRQHPYQCWRPGGRWSLPPSPDGCC